MWASALSAPSAQPLPDSGALALQASAPFSGLVRLTVGVSRAVAGAAAGAPSADALVRAPLPPGCMPPEPQSPEDDDGGGALAAAALERLLARAHAEDVAARLARTVPEVGHWCVARPQAAEPDTVQLVVPKVRHAAKQRMQAAMHAPQPQLSTCDAACGHWPLGLVNLPGPPCCAHGAHATPARPCAGQRWQAVQGARRGGTQAARHGAAARQACGGGGTLRRCGCLARCAARRTPNHSHAAPYPPAACLHPAARCSSGLCASMRRRDRHHANVPLPTGACPTCP